MCVYLQLDQKKARAEGVQFTLKLKSIMDNFFFFLFIFISSLLKFVAERGLAKKDIETRKYIKRFASLHACARNGELRRKRIGK